MVIIYEEQSPGYLSPDEFLEAIQKEYTRPSEIADACEAIFQEINKDVQEAGEDFCFKAAQNLHTNTSKLRIDAIIEGRKRIINSYYAGEYNCPQPAWFTEMTGADPFYNLIAITPQGVKPSRIEDGTYKLVFSEEKIASRVLLSGEVWPDDAIYREIQTMIGDDWELFVTDPEETRAGDEKMKVYEAYYRYKVRKKYYEWFRGVTAQVRAAGQVRASTKKKKNKGLGLVQGRKIIVQNLTLETLYAIFKKLADEQFVSTTQITDFESQIASHFSISSRQPEVPIDWLGTISHLGSFFTALNRNKILVDDIARMRSSLISKHFTNKGRPIKASIVSATMSRDKGDETETHQLYMGELINIAVNGLRC